MEGHKIKVLELFSGIGGMHYSLCLAKQVLNELYDARQEQSQQGQRALHGDDRPDRFVFDFEVVSAVDISEVANKVYRHNFPDVNHSSGNICGLKPEVLTKKGIEAIFMSPPCQPFTRQGLQKDLQEFLINPTDFGIPNSRLRYYLIGKRKPEAFGFETSDAIHTSLDLDLDHSLVDRFRINRQSRLSEFLSSDLSSDEQKLFAVPDKVLQKHSMVVDIVRPDSHNSCCFTKAYTKYAEGTGSVIQQQGDLEFLEQVFERAAAAKNSGNRTNPYTGHGTVPNPDTGHGTVPDLCVTALRELRLRYFTPLEIAKILGFPVEAHPDGEAKFEFPPDIPANSRLAYRVLGNSLSVTTVSFLTVLLFMKA